MWRIIITFVIALLLTLGTMAEQEPSVKRHSKTHVHDNESVAVATKKSFRGRIIEAYLAHPSQVEAILKQETIHSDELDKIQCLIDVLKWPKSRYFFVPEEPDEHHDHDDHQQDGPSAPKTPGYDTFINPLQLTVSQLLANVIEDKNEPDISKIDEFEHEWMAHQWIEWWRDYQFDLYAKLKPNEVGTYAANGNPYALHYLATLDNDHAQKIMEEIGTSLANDDPRQAFVHSGRAQAGDDDSKKWMLESIKSLSARNDEQAYAILDAVVMSTNRSSYFDALAEGFQVTAAKTNLDADLNQAKPSRAYLTARALSSVTNDASAPKIHALSIYEQRDSIQAWSSWIDIR